jgi:hypothetical protein
MGRVVDFQVFHRKGNPVELTDEELVEILRKAI